jgi:hypothetical protein
METSAKTAEHVDEVSLASMTRAEWSGSFSESVLDNRVCIWLDFF